MEIEHAAVELAYAIRRALRPHFGGEAARRILGTTESGDASFALDEVAECAVEGFIRKHHLPVAYYSEGRGLVEHGRPEHLLVIDPIDGTRPAISGIEGGVVSIAVAPYSRDAVLDDVTFGCIVELKRDRLYTAQKGGVAAIRDEGEDLPVNLRLTADPELMSWSFEIAGRPVLPMMEVLGPMVDRSSLRGGVFVISSIAYSLTRMVSGQFDAVVDLGNRLLKERPTLRQAFLEAGFGAVVGLFPYDIAAAVLIVETAGGTVTDAFGHSLGSTPLLDTSERNVRSCLAASNPGLHRILLSEMDQRFEALSSLH